jgi:hypothetical protein
MASYLFPLQSLFYNLSQVYPAVFLTCFTSAAVILVASLALMVQISLQYNSGPFHRRLVLTSGPFHRSPVLPSGPSLRIPEFVFTLPLFQQVVGDHHNISTVLNVLRNWSHIVSNKLIDVSETPCVPAYHTE